MQKIHAAGENQQEGLRGSEEHIDALTKAEYLRWVAQRESIAIPGFARQVAARGRHPWESNACPAEPYAASGQGAIHSGRSRRWGGGDRRR